MTLTYEQATAAFDRQADDDYERAIERLDYENDCALGEVERIIDHHDCLDDVRSERGYGRNKEVLP
jgi:hypothetical protein